MGSESKSGQVSVENGGSIIGSEVVTPTVDNHQNRLAGEVKNKDGGKDATTKVPCFPLRISRKKVESNGSSSKSNKKSSAAAEAAPAQSNHASSSHTASEPVEAANITPCSTDSDENQLMLSDVYTKFQPIIEGLDPKRKSCLLCFAVFPENAVVKKRLLLYWWIGEDFLDPENSATDILKDFMEQKLILPVNDKRKKTVNRFKMDPEMHRLVIFLARRDKFFNYNPQKELSCKCSESDRACLSKSEKQSESDNVEKIKTLFNVDGMFHDFTFVWFSKMKMVQVLCLGMWKSDGEHEHIEVDNTEFLKGLKSMGKLKLLSLCGISRVRELPGSISKLGQLKILDLKACYNLESLPREIKSLKTLTHLDISGCYLLDHMPKELRELSGLQVLKGFVIGDVSHRRSACTLDDLAVELKNLRKLSINVNSDKFSIEDFWRTVLVNLKQLEKLKIEWGGGFSQANHQHHQDDESKKLETDEVKPKTTATATARAADVVPPAVAEIKMDNKSKKLETGEVKPDTTATVTAKVAEKRMNKLLSKLGKSKIGRGVEIKLEKLELQCFPEQRLPKWLVAENLRSLKTLCIRGGGLEKLQEGKVPWGVVDLRLKYLSELKIDWNELKYRIFPDLKYLEKFKCPKVTLCPCDGSGVWLKSSTS